MSKKVLSRHDLKWLVETLSDVQAKWYIIGVQLDLPSGDLDAINKDNLATSMALTSMLKLWLAGANPSVDVLSKALQTKIVAESRLGLEILMETCGSPAPPLPQSPILASEVQGTSSLKGARTPLQPIENSMQPIENSMPLFRSTPKATGVENQSPESTVPNTPVPACQDSGISLGSPRCFNCKCGSCTPETYLIHGCPEGSFPYLVTSGMSAEERQQLESRLQSETNKIIRFFDDVATATLESFRQQKVSLHTISMHVTNLRPLIKPASQRSISRIEWKTIEECFARLANYWSWFNTHILEQLIEHCGTEEDQRQMSLYLEVRKDFLKRSIFSIPQNAYGAKRHENSRKLVLKLANNTNETEANILEDIRVLVYETLQMHVELLKVKTGCLELTFQIPDREVHLSQDQKSTLSREGVFFLAIDGGVYLEDISKSENEPPPDDSALCLKTTPGILRKRSASEDCTPCTSKTRRKSPRHNSSPAVYYNRDNTTRTKTVKAY